MITSIVVHRDVYERLSGSTAVYTEDREMWVGIGVQYPICYETEPLEGYRMHSDSNTGRHVCNGDDMRYTPMAIEIFRTYLPQAKAAEI